MNMNSRSLAFTGEEWERPHNSACTHLSGIHYPTRSPVAFRARTPAASQSTFATISAGEPGGKEAPPPLIAHIVQAFPPALDSLSPSPKQPHQRGRRRKVANLHGDEAPSGAKSGPRCGDWSRPPVRFLQSSTPVLRTRPRNVPACAQHTPIPIQHYPGRHSASGPTSSCASSGFAALVPVTEGSRCDKPCRECARILKGCVPTAPALPPATQTRSVHACPPHARTHLPAAASRQRTKPARLRRPTLRSPGHHVLPRPRPRRHPVRARAPRRGQPRPEPGRRRRAQAPQAVRPQARHRRREGAPRRGRRRALPQALQGAPPWRAHPLQALQPLKRRRCSAGRDSILHRPSPSH